MDREDPIPIRKQRTSVCRKPRSGSLAIRDLSESPTQSKDREREEEREGEGEGEGERETLCQREGKSRDEKPDRDKGRLADTNLDILRIQTNHNHILNPKPSPNHGESDIRPMNMENHGRDSGHNDGNKAKTGDANPKEKGGGTPNKQNKGFVRRKRRDSFEEHDSSNNKQHIPIGLGGNPLVFKEHPKPGGGGLGRGYLGSELDGKKAAEGWKKRKDSSLDEQKISSSSHSILDMKPLDKPSSENLPRKFKLKVCGVSHTIQAESSGVHADPKRLDASYLEGKRPLVHHNKSTSKQVSESNRRRQRLILQENSDDEDDSLATRVEGRMYSSIANLESISLGHTGKELIDYNMLNEANIQKPKRRDSKESACVSALGVRKSSRVPKKRVLDGDEEDETPVKRRRRKRSEESDEDAYQVEEEEEEEEEAPSAEEEDIHNIGENLSTTGKRKQRRKPESDSSVGEARKEVVLTARQRSLHASKEGRDVEASASLIEFPQGLSHAVPRRRKDALTEAERQLKKEEAARRRRQQVEKAEKEIQAVAIQKVLSQDSSRKKREDKLQKQRDEIEQEKRAAAMVPATNSIRWVYGPSGTVVSFSQDMELPAIFSGPCSYPKERAKCAVPSCNNTYKYRDSKSKLPLCSLQCYKAVQNLPGMTPLC